MVTRTASPLLRHARLAPKNDDTTALADSRASVRNSNAAFSTTTSMSMLRPVRKTILRHPGKLAASLVACSSMYTYARVLVVHYCLGALHHWIYWYPRNFPHAFFIPFFYVSVAAACVGAIYHDAVVLPSGLWKYALATPLTLRGRLWRIAGVPTYAFAIAALEAIQYFRNPNLESDLSRLAIYFHNVRDHAFVDDLFMKKMLLDVKWQAWMLRTASPTTASYIRLPLEVLGALLVCVVYGIAVFCNEPRHDADELREATRNNDVVRVKRILARGVNPNTKSDDGATPLHICAQQALVSPARTLLANRADPNMPDRLGFTALHWAVQLRREEQSSTNRLEMIRLLVRSGADPRRPDPSGVTPLTLASKRENESSLEVLNEVMQTTADSSSSSNNLMEGVAPA